MNSVTYPRGTWAGSGVSIVPSISTATEKVLDIVKCGTKALVATTSGMYAVDDTYDNALEEASNRDAKGTYWAARQRFEHVHAARVTSTANTNTPYFNRNHETGRWTATQSISRGTLFKCAATPFEYTGAHHTSIQQCSARSAAMLGWLPTDAMLVHEAKHTSKWYDTFNNGPVCVFGMPLSDNPVFVAIVVDTKTVGLLTLCAVDCNDDLTLATGRARQQLAKSSAGFPILVTTPTPPSVVLEAAEIPPLTQVITTTNSAIHTADNLHAVPSLRCIVGPVTHADAGAVPEHVQVVEFSNKIL